MRELRWASYCDGYVEVNGSGTGCPVSGRRTGRSVGGGAVADFGICAADYCDREAKVYCAGPTLGPSPRLTIIGGVRGAHLAASEDFHGALEVRCVDCAIALVEEVAERG
jgi:hypothetical protein